VKKVLLLVSVTALTLLSFPKVNFGQTAPRLGTTSGFALFTGTGSAFTNIGDATSVTGDAGANTGSHSAFPTGTLFGNTHWADGVSATAAADVLTAYSDLSAEGCGTVLGTPFGSGNTLTPGVYCTVGAAQFNGILTLDGGGDPDALFIFKINGALSTGLSSNVILTNSATPRNVYWYVVGAFSLGDGSVFRGNVFASGSVSLLEGSSLLGRALSTAGSIDLHNNLVTLYPAAAGSITGTAAVCQGQSAVSYSVPAITNATHYLWLLPAGATVVSGGDTRSIVVDFSAIAASGNITVQGSNDAGTGIISPNYAVTVNPLPLTSAIYHQ